MYIRDNISNTVRLYGTDCHDSLLISNDGKTLSYYNLQCGEGSRYGSYSFVTDRDGNVPNEDEDLIRHGAEAYFNIGGFNIGTETIDKIKSEIVSLTKTYPYFNHLDSYVKTEEVIEILNRYKELVNERTTS